MTTTYGFELIKEANIAEINTYARLFRHVATGAELLSLENDDENKVFGITFRTPPADSTGIAHILEHSVLAGSRKYPLKEPFIELVKGSLKTFVNAFTFPDKTCYPVASQNLQDFYNLIDVYLDAVFYPRLTPEVLQQEGWHYELEDRNDPMIYKGVVFNEMKGVYSSPDSLLGRYSQETLFPNNTYGFDSGGDPKYIPDLTYAQFKAFHQRFYHPANSRIFFYGDDDPEARLRLLQEYLDDFQHIEVDSAIALQPYFDQPGQVRFAYDAGEEAEGKKAYVTVNWLLPENLDPELTLSLSILSYILVGTAASPLRKALIDSGLGEDVTGGGLQTQLRQMAFSTGLKGTAVEDTAKVEELIIDTLGRLVRDGIETDMIEAAVNTIEFNLRENNTGSFPRGLSLMLRSLMMWLYDGDPFAPLAFETPLTSVKEKLAADPTTFEKQIDQYFLNNNHRVTVVLEPDPALGQRQEAAEMDRLAQARSAMSDAELQAVIDSARQLKLMQETPDPPEALATIPTLRLSDLDKDSRSIPLAISEDQSSQILYHDLFTNGIAYLEIGFNLYTLPQELLPYLPLFGQALLKIGTETEDFVKLSQRIDRKTGGIWPSSYSSIMRDSDDGTAWLFLRSKAMVTRTDDLLDILRDILLTVKLDNQERFRQMVLEAKARTEAGLIPGGHGIVNARLRAKFNEADWASEQMGGVTYLFFLRQLAEDVEHNWPSVLAKLENIRQLLINRNSMLCNVTLDEANWRQFQPKLSNFLSMLPAGPVTITEWEPAYSLNSEGLTIPAKVNYVGKGANLYQLGYKLHGSHLVVTNFLRTTWLWEKIRMQGGAYGGMCSFDANSGVFSFLSYRDPNLLETLANYDRASEFLRQVDLSEDEITKSIIGAIGQLDAYQLPDAKGNTSMFRYLIGLTDEMRQQRRDEVLGTTVADFRAFADVLERVNQEGVVVVLGAQEAIEAANAEQNNGLTIQKVM